MRRIWSANHTLAALGILGATVGLPGTLLAVEQYTNSAIMDPFSGKKARVVGNGLVVTGTVNANPASLLTAYRSRAETGDGACAAIAQAPAGKSLLLKSINVNAYGFLSTGSKFVSLYVGSGCETGLLQYVDMPAPGNESLAFEPGIVVPAGQALWARPNGFFTSVLATGFQLPSASLPATGSVAGFAKDAGTRRE